MQRALLSRGIAYVARQACAQSVRLAPSRWRQARKAPRVVTTAYLWRLPSCGRNATTRDGRADELSARSVGRFASSLLFAGKRAYLPVSPLRFPRVRVQSVSRSWVPNIAACRSRLGRIPSTSLRRSVCRLSDCRWHRVAPRSGSSFIVHIRCVLTLLSLELLLPV